jgi:hypothetical protein
VQGQRLGVVVEAPAKELSSVVGDVELDLFSRKGQSGIYLLVNEGKLCLELLPQLFVDLGQLDVTFMESSVRLELADLLLAFETGLPEPLLPRMQVNSKD